MNDQKDEDVTPPWRDDPSAYAGLVRTHYRHVFTLCFGMLANVHDAEDAAQETLLKGLRSLHKLAKPEQFESWILRIARNQCIDLLRRRKRARMRPVEPEPVSSPDAREDHDLEAAVARLPQELRLPLVLFYLEKKNAEEVARELGVSPSLVYERLRAAREMLHKLLTERGTHER